MVLFFIKIHISGRNVKNWIKACLIYYIKGGFSMKRSKILFVILVFGILTAAFFPGSIWAWGSKVHREVALDAWYYMEHAAQASQRQKDAIRWFYNRFNLVPNPWEKVAAGTTWPDDVQYVCFKGLSHKLDFDGNNFNSWYHFMDMYSAYWDHTHSRHNNCRNFAAPNYKGEHNSWDGYNYRRHEEHIADYDTDDIDSWAAWWIDDDNFCMTHSATGLWLYEYNQGGKGEGGNLIGSSNSGCYTRWDDDNPNSDFWNMIFAPVDNVGRAYYQYASIFRSASAGSAFNQQQALFYLGASMHATDAAILHHVLNSTDWGHSEIEDWASHWYNDQTWFHDQFNQIRWYLDSYYKQGGIDPVDRPFRWLVHQLAWVVFNNESIAQLWDRYVDEDVNDASYRNYCLKVYPACVAFAVIVMEKFYLGKQELFYQQAYDHQNSENVPVQNPNPPVTVTVTKMVLTDETDPEWGGSDDVYVRLRVEDGITAVDRRLPSSGEHDMDDGDTWNANAFIYSTANVGNSLKISIRAYDSDAGDDDLIGQGSLTLTAAQNWGKGSTHKIVCNGEGQMDVYVKID